MDLHHRPPARGRGEDDVYRFIGDVQPTLEAPDDAVDPAALVSVVDELRTSVDEEVWGTGELAHGGLGSIRTSLKWVDHLDLDVHWRLRMPFRPVQGWGQASDEEHDAMIELEESLDDALGDRGMLVARIFEKRRRVAHVYTDGSAAAAAIVREHAARWPKATLDHWYDPGWTDIASIL